MNGKDGGRVLVLNLAYQMVKNALSYLHDTFGEAIIEVEVLFCLASTRQRPFFDIQRVEWSRSAAYDSYSTLKAAQNLGTDMLRAGTLSLQRGADIFVREGCTGQQPGHHSRSHRPHHFSSGAGPPRQGPCCAH